jgi:prevent-host-death family protein
MSTYTVAEAKNKLSELINRAIKGEGVVITRHGHPVVELKSVLPGARSMTEADREWLRALRALPESVKARAAAEVRRMREEGDG